MKLWMKLSEDWNELCHWSVTRKRENPTNWFDRRKEKEILIIFRILFFCIDSITHLQMMPWDFSSTNVQEIHINIIIFLSKEFHSEKTFSTIELFQFKSCHPFDEHLHFIILFQEVLFIVSFSLKTPLNMNDGWKSSQWKVKFQVIYTSWAAVLIIKLFPKKIVRDPVSMIYDHHWLQRCLLSDKKKASKISRLSIEENNRWQRWIIVFFLQDAFFSYS